MTEIFNRFSERELRRSLRKTMPSAELLLWAKLRRRQVAGARFRRQYGVGRYVVDFYCPALRLAIEVDGPTHLGEDAVVYDRCRQEVIEVLGIEFLRFTNREIYEDLDGVVVVILEKVLSLQGNGGREEGSCCEDWTPPSAAHPLRKGRILLNKEMSERKLFSSKALIAYPPYEGGL
jgi:very-short-patch-repair endonuclease